MTKKKKKQLCGQLDANPYFNKGYMDIIHVSNRLRSVMQIIYKIVAKS